MTILPDSVLIESVCARQHHLANISDANSESILNKVKSLYFALWQSQGIATTEKIAEFYEVKVDTVYQSLKRHRAEFDEDGLKTLRGKAFKDVADILSVTSKTANVTIWTPRAALRLGMLLRDSEVAKIVRTSLLDIVEKIVPAQTQELERLKLELELARTQERLLTTTSAITTLHGSEMVALILGKPEAVITKTERVETVVTVDKKGKAIAQFNGVGITYLAKRYGFGSNTRACRYWLESIGIREEEWLTEPTLVKSQKLPRDILPKLDAQYAARTGVRQRLIGE